MAGERLSVKNELGWILTVFEEDFSILQRCIFNTY